MAHYATRVTEDGAIPLSPDARKQFGIRPGDAVELVSSDKGDILLHVVVVAQSAPPAPGEGRSIFEQFDELRLPSIGRPLTQTDIDEAIAEAVLDKDKRSRP
jgi:antitoxin PrlF